MNSKDLENLMSYATGTENYYRTVWGFFYTDGVKVFAEKAEAYWFIDEVGVALHKYYKMRDNLVSINLKVTGSKADIIYKGDDEKTFGKKHIALTDCPEGEWRFFFQDGVLFWNGEY